MIFTQFTRWPKGPVYLLVIALLIFLIASRFEGPLIFEINNEHGISLADLIAMIPLLISITWIQRGIWSRRIYLFNRVTIYPGAATLIVFSMGLGLGMLLAHAFYTFRYWWMIGGSLFIIILVTVVLKSGDMKPED